MKQGKGLNQMPSDKIYFNFDTPPNPVGSIERASKDLKDSISSILYDC